MPFTFSHPAIVLPLTYLPQKWYSLTGLVIGSITPDFEYFLRMKVQSDYSHTISGVFWFDLPLGILLAFLFHNFVRNSLFENLPLIFKKRFLKFKAFNWNLYFKKYFLIVIISIITGILSHLFWDSFTHENGYFVSLFPAFTKDVNSFGIRIPFYKVLQHVSSLTGGLVIIYALWKMPVDKTLHGTINLNYWVTLTLIVIAILSVRLFTGMDIHQYGNILVTAIAAGMIALILIPFIMGRTLQEKF